MGFQRIFKLAEKLDVEITARRLNAAVGTLVSIDSGPYEKRFISPQPLLNLFTEGFDVEIAPIPNLIVGVSIESYSESFLAEMRKRIKNEFNDPLEILPQWLAEFHIEISLSDACESVGVDRASLNMKLTPAGDFGYAGFTCGSTEHLLIEKIISRETIQERPVITTLAVAIATAEPGIFGNLGRNLS